MTSHSHLYNQLITVTGRCAPLNIRVAGYSVSSNYPGTCGRRHVAVSNQPRNICSNINKRSVSNHTVARHVGYLSYSLLRPSQMSVLRRGGCGALLDQSKDLCCTRRGGGGHQRQYSTVVHSPYPDITIPENISLPQFMLEEFKKYGNTTALIDGETGKKYSYSQLQTMVLKTASGLARMGVRKGSVVTIFSYNCPEYLILYLAVGCAGGICSTVNPEYTAEELLRSVNHVNSSVLVISPALLSVTQKVLQQCPQIKNVISIGGGGAAEGCRSFSSLLETDTTSFPDNLSVDSKNDVYVIPFSSGTTGLPKGVMLTHYNLVANILQSRATNALNYRAQDRILSFLPFYHIYGQVVVFLAGLSAGATIVSLPKFDPLGFLNSMQTYKATFLPVVPPILLFLAKHPMIDKFDFSSVETMFTGAAPCGADTIREITQRLNKNLLIRQGFGLTEASPVTHANPLDGNKHHTCGVVLQNTQYKIVDIASGETVCQGKKGELLVRGPQVMKGYYKNEKATAETIIDGWLHTGDVGYSDEDQHLIIVDRLKELIKVKGLQVAPAELEALLVTHPAVLDAAVIGRPDDRLGEAPVAFVVLRESFKPTQDMAKQLQQFVAENVAPFKRLVGGVEFLQSIPKSASGKILRRVLKQHL